MARVRVNWTLDIRAYNLIKNLTPKNKSMSEFVSQLILQKLQNPITALKEEKRQLTIKFNEIDDKIKHLEKIQHEKD